MVIGSMQIHGLDTFGKLRDFHSIGVIDVRNFGDLLPMSYRLNRMSSPFVSLSFDLKACCPQSTFLKVWLFVKFSFIRAEFLSFSLFNCL